MADFDPYRKWLGIPAGSGPPTHYQVLGIDPGERDPDVIRAAVTQRSAYVRNFQSGKHADDATRLLNEIAAAEACLTNPTKRAAYDAERKKKEPQPKPAPRRPAPAIDPLAQAAALSVAAPWAHPLGQMAPRPRGMPMWQVAAAIGGTVVVVLGVVLAILRSGGDDPVPVATVAPAPSVESSPSPPANGASQPAGGSADAASTAGPQSPAAADPVAPVVAAQSSNNPPPVTGEPASAPVSAPASDPASSVPASSVPAAAESPPIPAPAAAPRDGNSICKTTYQGGGFREYWFDPDGTVEELTDAALRGKLRLENGNWLLDFNDGKLERLTFAGDRYYIEHWVAAGQYPNRPPNTLAVGTSPDGIARVKETLTALGGHEVLDLPDPEDFFSGVWSVRYASGGKRAYRFVNRAVTETSGTRLRGQVRSQDGEWFLDFNDRKLERLTFAGDRIFVEHWDPANGFGRTHPTLIGIAARN